MGMSLSSLLGVIFGLVLVVGAIIFATSNPFIYLDWHAFLIVFGGSVAAAFMGYHSRDVMTAFKAVLWMVKKIGRAHV